MRQANNPSLRNHVEFVDRDLEVHWLYTTGLLKWFNPNPSTLHIPLEERCPPRRKSRVERLKASAGPLLT